MDATQKRFARLTSGFSKKLDHHAAAVGLYVAHYNLCRVHEALRTTPAVALGIAERVWTIGDLLDAVLPLEPSRPVRVTRKFTVIDGGKPGWRKLQVSLNYEARRTPNLSSSPQRNGLSAGGTLRPCPSTARFEHRDHATTERHRGCS
ncbi:hypothetical protein ACVIGB_009663 [Bradyrhizobium sp. USDA 4341]